jgi:hypothetical protein
MTWSNLPARLRLARPAHLAGLSLKATASRRPPATSRGTMTAVMTHTISGRPGGAPAASRRVPARIRPRPHVPTMPSASPRPTAPAACEDPAPGVHRHRRTHPRPASPDLSCGVPPAARRRRATLRPPAGRRTAGPALRPYPPAACPKPGRAGADRRELRPMPSTRPAAATRPGRARRPADTRRPAGQVRADARRPGGRRTTDGACARPRPALARLVVPRRAGCAAARASQALSPQPGGPGAGARSGAGAVAPAPARRSCDPARRPDLDTARTGHAKGRTERGHQAAAIFEHGLLRTAPLTHGSVSSTSQAAARAAARARSPSSPGRAHRRRNPPDRTIQAGAPVIRGRARSHPDDRGDARTAGETPGPARARRHPGDRTGICIPGV